MEIPTRQRPETQLEWLQSNHVRLMKCPAQSPVDRKIRTQNYTRKEDLSEAVIRKWHYILKETIDFLIGLMQHYKHFSNYDFFRLVSYLFVN